MALRNAIMATLAEGESSGYDLSKRFSVGVVTQQRRPTKRLFSLTDDGRAAIRDFSRSEPRPTAIRDELLVQVEAVALGDPAAVRASILDRRAKSEAKLAAYELAFERLRGGLSVEEYVASGERIGPCLTLMAGISFEHENIRWCEQAAEALARRS